MKEEMKVFKTVTNGNLVYYKADNFEKTGLVRHLFTTKCGGVSKGIYQSMNLRFNCDDERENVIRNFEIAAKELGTVKERLVLPNQIHQDEIIDVTEEMCGNGIVFDNKFESADGLITNIPGIALVTLFADCVPVMLLDVKQKVICTVHSGWKGTVKCIAAKAVRKMISEYGCRTENIISAIGPSIGVCHYEVSDEVAEIFRKKFSDDTVKIYEEKYHVNLQAAIKHQLIEGGVDEENINISGICTYCNHDLLFSHRYTKGQRGNLAGFLMLN